MTSAELSILRAELRAFSATVASAARVQKATLQQTYTLADLERRYVGLGRDRIVELLAQRCGYRGERGKRALVHLDQVLALDEMVRSEVQP